MKGRNHLWYEILLIASNQKLHISEYNIYRVFRYFIYFLVLLVFFTLFILFITDYFIAIILYYSTRI